MELLLASHGLSAVKDFLRGTDGRVLIVTNAATTPDVWESIGRDLLQLHNIGVSECRLIDVCDIKARRAVDEVAVSDAVFLEGGNQIRLMHDLRRSGFDEVLRNYLAAGGRYIGKSAGSIAAGNDVVFPSGLSEVWDRELAEVPDLRSTAGLGLVPHRLIPHYPAPEREAAFRIFEQNGLEPLAIADDAALLVSGDTSRFVPSLYLTDEVRHVKLFDSPTM